MPQLDKLAYFSEVIDIFIAFIIIYLVCLLTGLKNIHRLLLYRRMILKNSKQSSIKIALILFYERFVYKSIFRLYNEIFDRRVENIVKLINNLLVIKKKVYITLYLFIFDSDLNKVDQRDFKEKIKNLNIKLSILLDYVGSSNFKKVIKRLKNI